MIRAAYPDFTQFERGHEYEDPTSRPERPKWWMVDVGFVRKFNALITLDELRSMPALEGMALLQRGQRLSVQPVSAEQWAAILQVADAPAAARRTVTPVIRRLVWCHTIDKRLALLRL